MLCHTSGKKRICCGFGIYVAINRKRIRKKKSLIVAVLRCGRSKYSAPTLIAAVLLGTAAINPYTITLIAAVNEGPAGNIVTVN